MNYLGEKSLSSVLRVISHVSWYVVLVLSIVAAVIGVIIIFFNPFENPAIAEMAKCLALDLQDPEWLAFQNIPRALKSIFLPYFVVIVVLLLKIIKKSEHLFNNFKNNIVFNQNNVLIIRKISKLLIIFSILTVDIDSLLVCMFLLLLCEIFKNGTVLQEEQDLTV
ncbi:hypothetical protein K8S19_13175 [bacterium]|nr:hypothetical protein [bacterium]